MAENELERDEAGHMVGDLIQHTFAIVVGVIMMIAGLAMGVSVVLLPIGLPVGLLGLGLFLWGLFGRRQ
jgi:hypothetical protein